MALVVVIDANAAAYSEPEAFRHVLEAVRVLVNAHAIMGRRGGVGIVACTSSAARFLHPPPAQPESARDGESFSAAAARALAALPDLVRQESERDGAQNETLLAGALSQSLCFLNRRRKSTHSFAPATAAAASTVAAGGAARILVIQDAPRQYVSLMNCIFSAQRMGVAVDSCVVSESHSLFMQQAAHLTGGVYHRAAAKASLSQCFLTLFAADEGARKYLLLPEQETVDYRATCFCHKKVIHVGVVCPTCLSIFCAEPRPFKCKTCGTRLSK